MKCLPNNHLSNDSKVVSMVYCGRCRHIPPRARRDSSALSSAVIRFVRGATRIFSFLGQFEVGRRNH